jgi:hypothetical protein
VVIELLIAQYSSFKKRGNCKKVNKTHGEMRGRAAQVPVRSGQNNFFLVQGGHLHTWEFYLLL